MGHNISVCRCKDTKKSLSMKLLRKLGEKKALKSHYFAKQQKSRTQTWSNQIGTEITEIVSLEQINPKYQHVKLPLLTFLAVCAILFSPIAKKHIYIHSFSIVVCIASGQGCSFLFNNNTHTHSTAPDLCTSPRVMPPFFFLFEEAHLCEYKFMIAVIYKEGTCFVVVAPQQTQQLLRVCSPAAADWWVCQFVLNNTYIKKTSKTINTHKKMWNWILGLNT